MYPERLLRRVLVAIAVVGLTAGILAHLLARSELANLCWTMATGGLVSRWSETSWPADLGSTPSRCYQ